MTDYAWFVIKTVAFMALIGFVCWVTGSGTPLWALLLFPSDKGGK